MESEQIKMLETPPPPEALKTRQQAGRTLTYIEGQYVIETANRIFGPDKWSRFFVHNGLREVHRETKETDKGTRYDVAMLCDYQVRTGNALAEDVGYGIGQSYISLGDAFESAAKEAVTDALKRCLRSFGNAFGNCLYDKVWLADNAGNKAKPTPKPTPEPKTNSKVELWKQMESTFGPKCPKAKTPGASEFVKWLMDYYEQDDYELLKGELAKVSTVESGKLVKEFLAQ